MENHSTSSAKKGKKNKKKGKGNQPSAQTQNKPTTENLQKTDIGNAMENSTCPDPSKVKQTSENSSVLVKTPEIKASNEQSNKEKHNGERSEKSSQNKSELAEKEEIKSVDVPSTKGEGKINENSDKSEQNNSASRNKVPFDVSFPKNETVVPLEAPKAVLSSSKQDLLLAALEKPCIVDKSLVNNKAHTDNPEKCKLDAKVQETSKDSTLELDKKREKELRKLEWQKKMMEQNMKNDENEKGLSKAELKAKRREQQEAQRLAKLASKDQKSQKSSGDSSKVSPPDSKNNLMVKELSKQPKSAEGTVVPSRHIESISKTSTKVSGKTRKSALDEITKHLYCASKVVFDEDELANSNNIHPAFKQLGAQMHSKVILGSNARCLSMLHATKKLVSEIQTPPKQEFCRYLENTLQSCIDYLNKCRPIAVCMMNALKYFKSQLTQIDINLGDKEKRFQLLGILDTYVQEEIEMAGESIMMDASARVEDGDVILTSGCSSLVRKVLLRAKEKRKKFKVLVVDCAPLFEGKEMVRKLILEGVQCEYVLPNALQHVIESTSLVFLGAHALLSDGHIKTRSGSAMIALVAKSFGKPVIICSEAYKLSDQVQSDPFVNNEVGDENETVDMKPVHNLPPSLTKSNNVSIIHLLYDYIPPANISVIITELGTFHPKSINSIRRMKPTKLL